MGADDEAIKATNDDATECKRSAVELGYWQDDYIRYFVKHVERKAPEINRGYYARVRAFEMFIHQFLERCGTKCQIINLGCGYDTLFWRLRDTTQAISEFIEVDFPSVVAKKMKIIMRNKKLLEKISSEDTEVEIHSGDLHGAGYRLLGCDLRCAADLERKLLPGVDPRLPALVLAECVLVYLEPAAGDRLLALLANRVLRGAVLMYEQVALQDRFGGVMRAALRARGAALAGAAAGAGAGAQRLLQAGWDRAKAWDMCEVWAALPGTDRARAERLELLDEEELLRQLHQHYALTLGTRGDLFADMDLYA